MIRPGRHAQVLRNSEPRWRLPKRLHDFSLGVGQLPYGCPAPSLLGIRLATQASPLWGNRSQAMRVCQKVPTPRPGGWNLELGHVSGPVEMCCQLSASIGLSHSVLVQSLSLRQHLFCARIMFLLLSVSWG